MMKKIKEKLHEEILQKIDLSREVSDEEIEDIIAECILKGEETELLTLKEKLQLRNDLFDLIRKKGVIQQLIDDPEVTEIMVNGTEGIFVEKAGRLYKWDKTFESREELNNVIQQIAAGSNRVVNEASPIVDARLENGSRVNIVMNSVALNGPILTIRRFPENPIRMDDLIGFGTLTAEIAEFIRKLVVAGYNIFVSGGTGSGKTTFLNAMSAFIPPETRVITIEDSAELQIEGIENLVKLETRNANVEGCEAITIRDLIKSSLRMRPDRIVVGEVRDGAAFDFLQAANTGHDGSLCTGHANSAADMVSRLEMMTLMGESIPLEAIRRQIASAVDIIIHLGRMRDKSRKVLEITELCGYEDGEIVLNPIYKYDGEALACVGELKSRLKLERIGF